MALIFLSHSSVDEREAVALKKWLTDKGWDDVFLDIDPQRGLIAGERWQEALRQAADRCEAVIFIVSPAWAKSKWCLAEFLLAKSLHKQIFGVILKDVPIGELPTEMTSEWQLCRLIGTGPTEIIQFRHRDTDDSIAFMTEGLARLKTGLRKAGLSADFFPWPPKDEPHRSPFRGLEPLDFEDAAVFFGRDLEILRGLDALRGLRDNPATRLFVILGASGTGKSSFLRAGLLPRLARDDRHFLPLSVVRPETAPISGDRGLAQALCHSMEQLGVSGSNPGDLKARLSAGSGELAAILSSIQEAARVRFVTSDEQSSSPAPTLVLPVDQAEELFNADAGPESRKFLSLISEILRDAQSPAGASSPAASLIVVFTIRSDRYEPLQTAPELAGLQTTVFDDLKPMSATRFHEMITGPVQRASSAAGRLEIKPDLVERLVADCATGADTLPLLSLTLERLYHDFGSDGDLRLDEYIALGGIGNIIKDQIAKALDPDPAKRKQQLTLLRTAFIPWLVTINPQNDEPMRRLARRSDLPEDSLPLVDVLAENRLLMRDQRHNETVIEVAHETLLRQWDVLAGWVQDERAALKEADALERQSREWKESGCDESWLWGGQRLQDALALAGRTGFRKRVESCSEFLERSRKLQEQRDAEKLRIQTEKLKAAEDLAATQSKLAQEQAAAREQAEKAAARAKRQFRFAAALGVIAILFLGNAVVVSYAWRNAKQETEAKNRALKDQLHEASHRDFGIALKLLDEWKMQLSDSEEEENNAHRTKWHEAIAYLARSLEQEPQNFAAQAWLYHSIVVGIRPGAHFATRNATAPEIEKSVRSPDGHSILLIGKAGTWRLWDLKTETLSPEINSGSRNIDAAQFSPDGSKIVTVGNDEIVRIWDVASRRELAILKGHENRILAVAVSPDGRLVATAGADNVARIWDVTTGDPRGEPLKHENAITTVTFSPDGTRLVTSSRDNTIRLWNVTMARPIGPPMKFMEWQRAVAFTLDGRSFLSAADNGELRIWDALTGRPLGAPFVQDPALSALGVDFQSENEELRASISLSIYTKDLIDSFQLPQISRLGEFLQWTEGVSGLHFDADGQLTSISSEERLSRLYTSFVDAHDESKWAKLIRWVQTNPKERRESP
jgi:WD40 repeat protein